MSKNNNGKVPLDSENGASTAQDLINDPSFMSALEFLASHQQQNAPMATLNTNSLMGLPQGLSNLNTQQYVANPIMIPNMGSQQSLQMMTGQPMRSSVKQKTQQSASIPMQQQQGGSNMIDPNFILAQQALAMGMNPNAGSLPMTLDPSILRGTTLPHQQHQQSLELNAQNHSALMGMPDWRVTLSQAERNQVIVRIAQEILNVLAPDQRNDGRVRNLAGALEKQIYEKSTSKAHYLMNFKNQIIDIQKKSSVDPKLGGQQSYQAAQMQNQQVPQNRQEQQQQSNSSNAAQQSQEQNVVQHQQQAQTIPSQQPQQATSPLSAPAEISLSEQDKSIVKAKITQLLPLHAKIEVLMRTLAHLGGQNEIAKLRRLASIKKAIDYQLEGFPLNRYNLSVEIANNLYPNLIRFFQYGDMLVKQRQQQKLGQSASNAGPGDSSGTGQQQTPPDLGKKQSSSIQFQDVQPGLQGNQVESFTSLLNGDSNSTNQQASSNTQSRNGTKSSSAQQQQQQQQQQQMALAQQQLSLLAAQKQLAAVAAAAGGNAHLLPQSKLSNAAAISQNLPPNLTPQQRQNHILRNLAAQQLQQQQIQQAAHIQAALQNKIATQPGATGSYGNQTVPGQSVPQAIQSQKGQQHLQNQQQASQPHKSVDMSASSSILGRMDTEAFFTDNFSESVSPLAAGDPSDQSSSAQNQLSSSGRPNLSRRGSVQSVDDMSLFFNLEEAADSSEKAEDLDIAPSLPLASPATGGKRKRTPGSPSKNSSHAEKRPKLAINARSSPTTTDLFGDGESLSRRQSLSSSSPSTFSTTLKEELDALSKAFNVKYEVIDLDSLNAHIKPTVSPFLRTPFSPVSSSPVPLPSSVNSASPLSSQPKSNGGKVMILCQIPVPKIVSNEEENNQNSGTAKASSIKLVFRLSSKGEYETAVNRRKVLSHHRRRFSQQRSGSPTRRPSQTELDPNGNPRSSPSSSPQNSLPSGGDDTLMSDFDFVDFRASVHSGIGLEDIELLSSGLPSPIPDLGHKVNILGRKLGVGWTGNQVQIKDVIHWVVRWIKSNSSNTESGEKEGTTSQDQRMEGIMAT